MSTRIWDAVALSALGFAALATAVLYDNLPDPLATHFDVHGNPNGWMPRAMGAWFAPVFGVVIWAVVRFLPRVLPKIDKRGAQNAGPIAIVAACTAVFMSAVHFVLLRVALVPGASVNRPVFVLVGALFVAIGLVMPRVKRNAFIGVRTPWTLTSDENWARTQRVGGYAMVIGGVAAGALGAFGGATFVGLAIGVLLLSAVVPAVYSLVLARRFDRGA